MGEKHEPSMTTRAGLPEALVEGFLRLCQGEFSYRLPRTFARDEDDAARFYFNAIAEEVERLIRGAQEQEQRLSRAVEVLSDALVRVASGDLAVSVERDHLGDSVDVLAFLVNNTISELRALVSEKEKAAERDRSQLEHLVQERTRRLEQSEQGFRRLLETAPVPMLVIGLSDSKVRFANRRASALFEISEAELFGRVTDDLFHDREERGELVRRVIREGRVEAVTLRLLSVKGRPIWALVAADMLVLDGEPTLMIGITDLTEQKRIEDRLRELATIDSLTGALNRYRLFEVAEDEVQRARRYDRPLCFAMLDLDHFKQVNDRFGHLVGDEALKLVTATVRSRIRAQDAVGRFGGEELAIVMPETRRDDAVRVVDRIRADVRALEMMSAGEIVPLGLSAGVVEWRADELVSGALTRVDAALYDAKSRGRNRVVAGD